MKPLPVRLFGALPILIMVCVGSDAVYRGWLTPLEAAGLTACVVFVARVAFSALAALYYRVKGVQAVARGLAGDPSAPNGWRGSWFRLALSLFFTGHAENEKGQRVDFEQLDGDWVSMKYKFGDEDAANAHGQSVSFERGGE